MEKWNWVNSSFSWHFTFVCNISKKWFTGKISHAPAKNTFEQQKIGEYIGDFFPPGYFNGSQIPSLGPLAISCLATNYTICTMDACEK